jgi:hypothetical protein
MNRAPDRFGERAQAAEAAVALSRIGARRRRVC